MTIANNTELFTEEVDISSVATTWKYGYDSFHIIAICFSIITAIFLISWLVSFLVLKKVKFTRKEKLFSFLSAIGITLIAGFIIFPNGNSYGETSFIQRIWTAPASASYQINNEKYSIIGKGNNHNQETISSLVRDKIKDSFDEKKKEYDFIDFDTECEKEYNKTAVFCGGDDFKNPLEIGDNDFWARISTPHDYMSDFGFAKVYDSPHKTTVRATIRITHTPGISFNTEN